MEKNEIVTGRIESLGANGEGVFHHGGIPVFVPYALTGETATCKIVKVEKNLAFARLESVADPSPFRRTPPCPVFRKCGGCALQHLSYPEQLKWKSAHVADCFQKIGRLAVSPEPTVPSPKKYAYRNKLVLAVGKGKSGTEIGLYAENSHRIVPIEKCAIQPDWAETAIGALTRYMSKYKIEPYDEATGKGLVRRLSVREVGGRFLIVLVASSFRLPHVEDFYREIGGIGECTLYLNRAAERGNAVFGREFRLLFGAPYLQNEEMGVKFEVGPESFLQVNDGVRALLYDAVRAEVSEDDTVIDAYSGAGILTALLAQKARAAYGIEVVAEAVRCADRLAENNGLKDKIRNMTGDCALLLPPLAKRLSDEGKRVTVVLDPPRKGVAREVLEALLAARPERIVYVSCNPATLARDVGVLCGSLAFSEGGLVPSGEKSGEYRLESLRPFDMFPETRHVETLVVLSHKNPTDISA